RNAGSIFLGRHTPEAIGDYVAGSNHVLPTARSARFSSGLSVLDFVKRSSILRLGPEQLRQLAPAAIALAEAEGLAAHGRAGGGRLDMEGARAGAGGRSARRLEVGLDASIGRRTPDVGRERAVAMFDLIEENGVRPVGDTGGGPYRLKLSISEK